MTAWLTRASCPTCTCDSLFAFIIRATRTTMSTSSSGIPSSGAAAAAERRLLFLREGEALRAGLPSSISFEGGGLGERLLSLMFPSASVKESHSDGAQ